MHLSQMYSATLAGFSLKAAERAGMGPAEFFQRTGLSQVELDDPRARISLDKMERVNEVSLLLAGTFLSRALVLHTERLQRLGLQHPLTVAAWLNAPSAREAIGTYATYFHLLGGDWLALAENDEDLRVEFSPAGAARPGSWRAMSCFRTLMAILRSYPACERTRFSVRLQGATDLRGGGEEALELALAQPANHLVIPRRGLDQPNPFFNPAVARVTARHLARQCAELEQEGSLAQRAEGILRGAWALHPARSWTMEEAQARLCSELGTTRRGLQRRLALEGTSFGALWTRARLDVARRLLEDTRLSVAEISDLLGFGQRTALTRFFRREQGVGPLRFRQQRTAS